MRTGELGQVYGPNESDVVKLQAEIARLRSIIRRILKHIENGTLVRDISKDADVGWALAMMRLVVDLKDATEAVDEQRALEATKDE